MTEPISFRLNGASLLADPSGVLLWPERATLIVADLHLEKGSSFARKGAMLPPYDTGATLTRLARTIEDHRPARVICLGDSFHDPAAASRVSARDGEKIRTLTHQVEWIWIAGNHDPAPPSEWGRTAVPEMVDGPLTFRHAAAAGGAPGEVSGHYHPKARIQARGKTVSGRCFVTDGRRLVLPAFGAYTGGLDIGHPDIRRLLARRFEVFLLAAERVWRVPASKLMASARV